MSEQTCKTCKHWERGGVCKKITGEYGRVCIQSKDESPWLMTVSDFGCTLWECAALFGSAPAAQLGVPRLDVAAFEEAVKGFGAAVQKVLDVLPTMKADDK